jgi:hypothetical protein
VPELRNSVAQRRLDTGPEDGVKGVKVLAHRLDQPGRPAEDDHEGALKHLGGYGVRAVPRAPVVHEDQHGPRRHQVLPAHLVAQRPGDQVGAAQQAAHRPSHRPARHQQPGRQARRADVGHRRRDLEPVAHLAQAGHQPRQVARHVRVFEGEAVDALQLVVELPEELYIVAEVCLEQAGGVVERIARSTDDWDGASDGTSKLGGQV